MTTTTSSPKSKRDDLIEVAAKLFYEQGYHCTGVQQIIQEAGIAKGTFYSHFKSKEALGCAWLKARHHEWTTWLLDSISGKTSAKAKILGVFDFLGTWMQECDYRGCAFMNTLSETPAIESPLRVEIVAHLNELKEMMNQLVDDHLSARSKKERSDTFKVIFVLFEGALTEIRNTRDTSSLPAVKALVKSLL
ncbi:MAG: AcrR family transcriptional regulator [Lentimonas sp.]|jgi:AcrR family transcriptional regulator